MGKFHDTRKARKGRVRRFKQCVNHSSNAKDMPGWSVLERINNRPVGAPAPKSSATTQSYLFSTDQSVFPNRESGVAAPDNRVEKRQQYKYQRNGFDQNGHHTIMMNNLGSICSFHLFCSFGSCLRWIWRFLFSSAWTNFPF